MSDAFVFLKGDDVIGKIGEQAARGNVVSFDAKNDILVIQHRGPSVMHESNRMIKGAIEQTQVKASEFELLYRKPKAAKEKK